MAARFARSIGALSSSVALRSAAGIETFSHGAFKSRCSSYSSSSESEYPKPTKKITDRFSGVIDSVNDQGQFENLPGKGKPLDLNTNPHADPAEDTLYRILSRNKCAPEWVELNKEIRSNVVDWRSALKKAWTHKDSVGDSKWIEASESLKLQMRDINNKVFRYNLIVPFGREMFGLKWEKEIDRLKEESAGS
uniref:DnaJ homolog subfamily C member 28-like isoform X1 n=1 Tax=Nicotiana tabacum TaxID=4097 RepID=A0A1S4A270_TOBAC|nr:PREDICTED: dnaJ homolog subfamily C member 28-like isoform X1 [Nicotiana tabacum]